MERKYPPHIIRRANFVLDEARSKDCKRDSAINLCLRVISNWVTVEADGSSHGVKKVNRRMSRAAYDLKTKLNSNAREWHKSTTNEHPEELSLVWKWITENRSKIQASDVCDRLAKHPFVTITNDENRELRKLRKGDYDSPLDRYQKAKIEIIMLNDFE